MKQKQSTPVSIRMNSDEQTVAEWLAKKTKRTRNNAVNWAVAEKAVELGYKAEKPKSKKRLPSS